MKRIIAKELPLYVGKVVKICGWIEIVRDQKKRQFLIFRDSTGSVQVLNEKHGREELASEISQLNPGSAVEIIGEVVANEAVKLGGLEVILESIKIHSIAESPLPICKDTDQDQRLDWRFIDLWSRRNFLIFEVQSAVEQAMRRFFRDQGFMEIHTPKLMGAPSESGAELFELEYFGGKAYLAQSPQFYKQMAMAAHFERIFEIAPVFRAENSTTTRHSTEYTGVDVEFSWVNSHEDVMRFQESLIWFVLEEIDQCFGPSIKEIFGVDITVPGIPFPRVTMKEAYAILKSMGHVVSRDEKGDLDPEGERLLCRYAQKELGSEFIFVTEYPVIVRPFYHMRVEDNSTITKSYDLLWKGVEITTGAQREHRYDILKRQAIEKMLSLESLEYYLNFFRYGCPPHGGFGLGLARFIMKLLNLESVREAAFLHRGPKRLVP